MVGCIVCAGFTARLRISLVYGWLHCVCRLHREITDFFSLWLVALCVQASPWDYRFLWLHVPPARGSAHERRSGQPHRKGHSRTLAWGTGQSVHQIPIIHAYYSLSTCLLICRDSLHPCSPQSVYLPWQVQIPFIHARNSLLIFSDSHHPCSLQSVLLFWQVQIPIIHAHYSLSSYFDRSRFLSSMLTTVCWYFQIPFIHACYSLSTCLSIWVFDCVFSLHACTSCGLSTSFNLLINMSGSLHACYACSDVHSIVRPHLPVHISLWLCVPSSCLH